MVHCQAMHVALVDFEDEYAVSSPAAMDEERFALHVIEPFILHLARDVPPYECLDALIGELPDHQRHDR